MMDVSAAGQCISVFVRCVAHRTTHSDEVDAAVRAALVPDLDVSTTPSDVSKSPSGLVPANSSDFLTGGQYGLGSALPNAQDHTIATTVVRSSHLDKIQALLAKGDRRGACHYAADEKLWPHALIIASSIDKDAWKEVVTEWIRAELAKGGGQGQGESTERREALRVAYSLFGGNGAASGTFLSLGHFEVDTNGYSSARASCP